MQTQKGNKIEKDIEELTYVLRDHLGRLFDEWKRKIPTLIQEKIVYPLFTIDDDKEIGLNFPKEVIII